MKCRKCGSERMGVKPNKKNPSATDLFCMDCGAWQKFATKDEIRLYETCKAYRTNADIVRAMSDDELVYFLNQWGTATRAWQKDPGETLYWLQQPAEEEQHECT